MRIAYLVNQYPMTSLSFIRREITALEELGFEVDRYALRAWDDALVDAADQAEHDKTRYIQSLGPLHLFWVMLVTGLTRPITFGRVKWLAFQLWRKSDKSWLWHLAYLAEACVLVRWLKQSGAEHLHVHFASNPTEVAMFCRELGGPPYSFMVHGPEEIDRARYIGLDEKIARCKFVAAITNYCRSQLFRWCAHEDWGKIQIVHCGLDGMFLAEPPTPVSDSRQIVCVGRLGEQKGQLLLVEAAAQLKEQGESFELVLVGDGPMRQPIEALITQHGLDRHVMLAGWATNAQVRDRLRDARALVLGSFAEGLPVVIMEALALGRPVITTSIAGVPELVDASCGWVVPAGSTEALAEAMRACLHAGPETLNAMGAEGAKRVRAQHDVKAEAGKLAGLIRGAS